MGRGRSRSDSRRLAKRMALYDSHGALKRVAKRLPNAPGASHWLTEFDVMERFHNHFYHGQMSDGRIARYRPRARGFVARLLAVANEPRLRS